jgi:GNAT superfamily N-acetyltransferase
MLATIHIRAYRPADLPQVERLDAQVQPYRPEDRANVQAMYARALEAQRRNDARWMADPETGIRETPESYLAFWVAEPVEPAPTPALVGTVGVRLFQAGLEMPPEFNLAQAWQSRGDVAELRHLRVAPDARGQGLGGRLCQTVIDWTREQGYGTLVVNTTSAQLPALRLYQRLGFREVGRTFIDAYELVWSELGS